MTSLPVRTLPVLAAAALLALAATAHGQPAPIALPEVVVPLPPEDEVQVDPASPARRDPTGAISIVSVKDQAAPALETAQLVAAAPGVTVQDFGPGQTKTISIRGAGASGVLVLLDGVPLNGAGGVVDLSLIPLPMLDRLEVLGGAAGARYGSGGLGGAVNLVTPEVGRHVRLFARGTYGSFTTERGELSAELPAFGGGLLLSLHGAEERGRLPLLVRRQAAARRQRAAAPDAREQPVAAGRRVAQVDRRARGRAEHGPARGLAALPRAPRHRDEPEPELDRADAVGRPLAPARASPSTAASGRCARSASRRRRGSQNGYFTGGFAQAQAMAGAELEASTLVGAPRAHRPALRAPTRG